MTAKPPRREWLQITQAMSLVSRELYVGGSMPDAEEALIAALRDGIVRSRRQRFRDNSRRSSITSLEPKYWTRRQNIWNLPDPPDKCEDHYEVNHHELREWLNPTAAPQAAARRGRPPIWDWESFWVQAVLLANTPDGLPDKQADFESLMTVWFEKEAGKAPAPSQIRERASKLYTPKAEK